MYTNEKKVGFVKPGTAEYFHPKGPTFLFACGSPLLCISSNVQDYIFKTVSSEAEW